MNVGRVIDNALRRALMREVPWRVPHEERLYDPNNEGERAALVDSLIEAIDLELTEILVWDDPHARSED